MRNRVLRILFSMPVLMVAGAIALYLAIGFVALPALLKWQLEKQVRERLGHQLEIAALRFDPLRLRLEAEGVAMSDAHGEPMAGWQRLHVDLEWRSAIDRAWTFVDVTLEAPSLRLVRGGDGRHNFSALFERLAELGGDTSPEPPGPLALPPLAVQRAAVSNGVFEMRDAALAEPKVIRLAPMSFEVDALSSVSASPARYRVSLPGDAGERVESDGEIMLRPLRLRGTLALRGWQVETLARALSRELALAEAAGIVALNTRFELGQRDDGTLEGGLHAADVELTGLVFAAPGAGASRLRIERIALSGGRADLATRDAGAQALRITGGRLAAAFDAQGQLDWSRVVRANRAAPVAPAEAAAAAAPEPPWRIAVDAVEVDGLALAFADSQASAAVGALSLRAQPGFEVGAGAFQVAVGAPSVALADVALRRGEATALTLPRSRVEARRLRLTQAPGHLALQLEEAVVAAPDGLSATQGDAGIELGALRIDGTRIALDGGGVSIDGARVDAQRLAARQAAQRAALEALSVAAARIALPTGGSGATVESLAATLAALDLQVPEDARAELRNAKVSAGALAWRPATPDTPQRLDIERPAIELVGIGASQGEVSGALQALALQAGSIALRRGEAGRAELALSAPDARAEVLALQRGSDGVDVRQLGLGSESMALTLDDAGRIGLEGGRLRAMLGGVAARRGADRLALDEAALDALRFGWIQGGAPARAAAPASANAADKAAANAPVGAAAAPAAAPAQRAQAETLSLRLGSLAVSALGSPQAIARLAALKADAAALQFMQAGEAASEAAGGMLPDLRGDGLAVVLDRLSLLDPRGPPDAAEWLRLDSMMLDGGTLVLRERSAGARRLALAGGALRGWIDAQGQFSVPTMYAAGTSGTAGPPAPSTPAPQAASAQVATPGPAASGKAEAPWRITLAEGAIDGLSLAFEDRREAPPFGAGVDGLRARIGGFDNASAEPMRVEASAEWAAGGALQVLGTAMPDGSALDLQIDADKLALAPVQPYLSKVAKLVLSSGTLSTGGQLRLGTAAPTPVVDAAAAAEAAATAPARLSYAGRASIDALQLDETAVARPFLSWQSVATDDLRLTLGPDRLDIGELRVRGPAGRLIIAEDQTVNLGDVLKRDGGATEPPAAADTKADAEAASAKAGGAEDEPAFPAHIARLRVDGGQLEFADLSLRPQFAARMHELKGVIIGLGTDPARPAQVQLDARVDDYGSARIRGKLSVTRPEAYTEIDMAFRNLEMTALSPYVAKFAGYRIADGRLALDLQYKLRDRKLLGENRIELRRVVLGEKVDSPDALDLPLDLAIAVLKDSNGVIDIGLPVSGDLDDPQFDYGEVIGKAIGNLLGGIVTAPFRALGALLGRGDKEIDTIRFEPGRAALAPPERQKVTDLARALKQRPALLLKIPPTHADAHDAPALRSLALRREIVESTGIALAPNEDPGPVDVADQRTQAAIEGAFRRRYAPAVLELLKQRAVAAMAPAPAASEVAGAPSAVAAAPAPGAASPPASAPTSRPSAPPAPPPAPPRPPADFYQGLYDRMLAEQTLDDGAVAQLALRRAEAIRDALTTEGGVSSDRVRLDRPRASREADDKAVALHLELGAMP